MTEFFFFENYFPYSMNKYYLTIFLDNLKINDFPICLPS